MNNMSRVAIFGGSFDPIHNGHLALAGEVLSRGLAGEVWFMVTPQNPHKQGSTLSDEQLRLQMVQLAVDGKPGMVACDFEFALPRPSYTLHTLNARISVISRTTRRALSCSYGSCRTCPELIELFSGR